jgi:hypothetical protein
LKEWKGNIIKAPKMNYHFQSWKSWNVLIFWNKNAKGKPCTNQEFFIPFESSQRLHIESELPFSIWSYKLRLIMKWKDQKSNYQTNSLIPNFKNPKSLGQMTFNESVQHGIEKILTKVIKLNGHMPQIRLKQA